MSASLVFALALASAAGAAQPPNLTGTWTPTTGGAWVLAAGGPGLTHLHADWAGIGSHSHLRGTFDGTLNSAGNAYVGTFGIVEDSNQVNGSMTFTIDNPNSLTVTLTANGGGSSTIVMTRSGGGSSSTAATMSGVTGKIEVQIDGGAWAPAGPSTDLKVGDRVHTGYKGTAKLTMPDGSTITLAPMSLLVVEQIETENEGSKTRLRVVVGLTGGALKAAVKRINEIATAASDFVVRTPTIGAGARGTVFTVFYDPGTKATVVGTFVDSVAVTPTRRGGKTVIVPAGKEVEVTPAVTSKLAALGNADARGGIDRARAFQLAAAAVARATSACGIDAPTGAEGFSVKLAAPGWLVTIPVAGAVRGSSTWLVAGARATPSNALAKQIAAGCKGAAPATSASVTFTHAGSPLGSSIAAPRAANELEANMDAGTGVIANAHWTTGGHALAAVAVPAGADGLVFEAARGASPGTAVTRPAAATGFHVSWNQSGSIAQAGWYRVGKPLAAIPVAPGQTAISVTNGSG